MSRALWLLATLAFGSQGWAESSGRYLAPSYSAASIVNSASNVAGALAPNSIATLYGSGLAYSTTGLTADDIRDGALPTVLAGVRVFVAGYSASLYYVSPRQINFLIPSFLLPGEMDLWVAREGTAGPHVRITVLDVAPALYQLDAQTIVASHVNGTVVTKELPARPDEVVVLWATGLGPTDPEVISGQISMEAAQIRRLGELRILVAGTALDAGSIWYAGVAPGSPGLYQINVKLPGRFDPDPEIRVALDGQTSPAALILPAAVDGADR